jgi:hypothetical protein
MNVDYGSKLFTANDQPFVNSLCLPRFSRGFSVVSNSQEHYMPATLNTLNTQRVVSNPAANDTNNSVNWPDMNQLLVQGRLLFAEKVQNNQGQFIAVTVATTTKKGSEGMSVVFNSSDLIDKFDNGWLVPGRRVTVIGKLAEVRTHYMRQGELTPLKRPELKLFSGAIHDFGALPKSNTAR